MWQIVTLEFFVGTSSASNHSLGKQTIEVSNFTGRRNDSFRFQGANSNKYLYYGVKFCSADNSGTVDVSTVNFKIITFISGSETIVDGGRVGWMAFDGGANAQ